MHIVALSDGLLFRDYTMMRGVPAEQAETLLGAAFRKSFVLAVNAFLIFSGERLVLIETGSGDYLGPAAGHLLSNLEAVGEHLRRSTLFYSRICIPITPPG